MAQLKPTFACAKAGMSNISGVACHEAVEEFNCVFQDIVNCSASHKQAIHRFTPDPFKLHAAFYNTFQVSVQVKCGGIAVTQKEVSSKRFFCYLVSSHFTMCLHARTAACHIARLKKIDCAAHLELGFELTQIWYIVPRGAFILQSSLGNVQWHHG